MESKSGLPLISCICVTLNRAEMLFKSVFSFGRQTYPNKELIITYPRSDFRTRRLIVFLRQICPMRIVAVEHLENDSIGKARNNAISNCTGDYICIWDDDDISHPSRLAEQYNLIKSGDGSFNGCVIAEIFLYHHYNKTAYLSFPSHWSCTLMCKREQILEHPCLDQDQFECSGIIHHLSTTGQLVQLWEKPELFTYVFHGKNLMLYRSFLYLMNESNPVPSQLSADIKKQLDLEVELPFLEDD